MSKQFSDNWPKQISVDKRIVKILSESTYENFPNALKEIITNSYDARANKVSLDVNIKKEKISIVDDGIGMTESDFDFFLRIAGKTRQRKEISGSKRKIIGQFGVGFVSIFPFFESFQIESKKSGNPEILQATIPCYKYFYDEKSENRISDVSSINITGKIYLDRNRIMDNYTKITLSGFTKLTQNFFFPSKEQAPRQNSIHKFDGITKLIWKLEEDLPIKYEEERFNQLFKEVYAGPPFDVFFNNQKLTRKVYGSELLETNQGDYKQFGKIKVKYFISTAGQVVKPNEGKHFKVRNLNVGVGDRTAFGLGEEVGGFRSKVNWLTGEIHILEGMNDLIKVSRDGFNFSPDYEQLKDFFIKRLSYHSTLIERKSELKKFLMEEKESTKLKNIKLLEPSVLKRKIVALRKKNTKTDGSNVVSDNITSNLLSNLDIDNYNKTILVNKKKYTLVLKKWNYKNDFFPACKLHGSQIILNKEYPFFKKRSQTDFFFKLHLLLLLNFNDNQLDKEAFKKINKDIFKVFNDYL